MVLEEVWSAIKPSVKNLKIFGSLCYKHTPDQGRRKLDDKSGLTIFVDYISTTSYKLYNLKTNQV